MELYAIHKDYAVSYLETIENASSEDRAVAFNTFGNDSLPDIIIRTEGSNEAMIKITGPLSPAGPNPIARFFGFGGTGYMDIISAAKSLENDPSIDTVRLAFDTPGGSINGMDPARQALESLASKKTVISENHGRMESAGYYLATAKGIKEIVAMSPLSSTGSIGVVIAGIDTSEALARNGVKRIKIISSNAPNKQADPNTTQGLKVHQNEIDAMERVFIRKVAEGRNTTDQDVIDNFGKGGMLIAQDPDPDKPDALKVGMIDSVVTQFESVPTLDEDDESEDSDTGAASDSSAINGNDNVPEMQPAADGGQQKGTIMDLTKLKAEHASLYAEVLAAGRTEGVEQGVKQERKRVDAHITMGEASGDMKLAMSCITDGVEHDAATNAKYMASQMNKNAKGDRADESENDLDTDGAGSDADADAKEQELATALAQELGVETDA